MILGCDISTSISGYTVINDKGEIVYNESVDTRRVKDLDEVIDINLKNLEEIINSHKIEHIFVEENLKSFAYQRSNASTLIKLSKLNGIFCYMSYREHGLKPQLLNPNSARSKYGLSIKASMREAKLKALMETRGIKKRTAKSKVTKEIVLDYIEEQEGDSFTYDMTYAGNPKPEAYDRADSLVVARAGEKIIKEA